MLVIFQARFKTNLPESLSLWPTVILFNMFMLTDFRENCWRETRFHTEPCVLVGGGRHQHLLRQFTVAQHPEENYCPVDSHQFGEGLLREGSLGADHPASFAKFVNSLLEDLYFDAALLSGFSCFANRDLSWFMNQYWKEWVVHGWWFGNFNDAEFQKPILSVFQQELQSRYIPSVHLLYSFPADFYLIFCHFSNFLTPLLFKGPEVFPSSFW